MCFPSKTEKVNNTFNFCIFELVYNPGYNIYELYNILVEISFTTRKTKLNISYSKLGVRVASRVTEGLNDLRKL